MIGVVLLFGVAATAVYLGARFLRDTAQEQESKRPCQHRFVVVMDGRVDYCDRCGQVVNT